MSCFIELSKTQNVSLSKISHIAIQLVKNFTDIELETARIKLHMHEMNETLLRTRLIEAFEGLEKFSTAQLSQIVKWQNKFYLLDALLKDIKFETSPIFLPYWKNNRERQALFVHLQLYKSLDDYNSSHVRIPITINQEKECFCGDGFNKNSNVRVLCDGNQVHAHCLEELLKHSNKCPYCGVIMDASDNGALARTSAGTLTINIINQSCAGYPGVGSILMEFALKGGKYNHNGKILNIPGNSYVAYLPNTPEGLNVLELLKTAFKLGHMFPYGISVSTGIVGIVYGRIHLKTALNSPTHGYPDSNYLKNVQLECLAKRIDAPLFITENEWQKGPFVVLDKRTYKPHVRPEN